MAEPIRLPRYQDGYLRMTIGDHRSICPVSNHCQFYSSSPTRIRRYGSSQGQSYTSVFGYTKLHSIPLTHEGLWLAIDQHVVIDSAFFKCCRFQSPFFQSSTLHHRQSVLQR